MLCIVEREMVKNIVMGDTLLWHLHSIDYSHQRQNTCMMCVSNALGSDGLPWLPGEKRAFIHLRGTC